MSGEKSSEPKKEDEKPKDVKVKWGTLIKRTDPNYLKDKHVDSKTGKEYQICHDSFSAEIEKIYQEQELLK